MPEQAEEGDKSNPKDQHGGEKAGEPLMTMFMDFDLDLDASSWPLGHQMLLPPITFSSSSNPMSPIGLFPSNSDQLPCSPLWALSDSEGLDTTATPTNRFPPPAFAGPGGLSFSDYPLSSTCNPSSVGGNPMENDDKKKVLSPLVGLMPMENPDGYCTFKERMTQALRYFIESTEQRVLAQVWAPIRKGGRCMLTTLGQPFVLDPQSTGLNQYRIVSVMYTFSVDGETDGQLGLPGRVFRQKLPEWSPNVQYYSSQEYSRLDHAFHHNVRGTLALPVFESSGQSCVGVLELILTSQKINYAPEVDKVCKALEAVNLKSSDILEHPKTQICDEARQNALAEILEILTVLCETYKLPLAQTWVPCMQRSVLAQGSDLKKSCTSFDGSCNGQVCMSTLDVSFYVVDAHKWGFREACLEHHLQNGQGVAGRAFYSHNSCFCRDITQFCKTQYPLVHYARLFGLTGSFAICLRSSHTGDDDYILEFFLPPNITDFFEQKTLLGFLLTTMKQRLHSLKVASGVDLEEEGFVEIFQASKSGTLDIGLECVQIPQSTKSSPEAHVTFNGGQFESLKNQPLVDVDAMDNGCNIVHANGSHANASLFNNKEKKPHKKRGKTEKSISLEVLQQYFAGSLKDAAKSLDVCPTTMKRICRQHGISRWPSRKINKVNRSLNKLKRVMESVQGTDGALCLNPLSTSPAPVAVSLISWPSNIHGCNQQNLPASRPAGPHDDHSGSTTCRTPRSTVQAGDEDHSLGSRKSSQEHPLMQNGSTPDFGEGSSKSRTGSGSQEESAGSPTCHGSCQSSPANDSTPAKNTCVSPCHEQCSKGGGLPEQAQPTEELNLLAACTMPEALTAPDVQEPFGRMLVEDAGSSKDLRNLCPSVADAILDEQFLEPSWTNPPCPALPPTQAVAPSIDAMQIVTGGQEMKSITIKATYREDIIRFRFSPSSGIVELKEQVGKRLKLEVGTFDIRYLDDDHEWVLIACNADLQECIDVSRSSGRNLVRLAVHDLNANLGSSCESTGAL